GNRLPKPKFTTAQINKGKTTPRSVQLQNDSRQMLFSLSRRIQCWCAHHAPQPAMVSKRNICAQANTKRFSGIDRCKTVLFWTALHRFGMSMRQFILEIFDEPARTVQLGAGDMLT